MHDFLISNLASQEMAREVRKSQFPEVDPDELWKHEMWDSLDSAPSFRKIIHRAASLFRRRKATKQHDRRNSAKAQAQSTQCAPQG